MWFRRKSPPTDDTVERIERLERGLRDLQTDWDTTYDKFAMLLKRWAKREKALAAGASAEATGGDGKPLRDLVSRRI
jgi:hypothetical protein